MPLTLLMAQPRSSHASTNSTPPSRSPTARARLFGGEVLASSSSSLVSYLTKQDEWLGPSLLHSSPRLVPKNECSTPADLEPVDDCGNLNSLALSTRTHHYQRPFAPVICGTSHSTAMSTTTTERTWIPGPDDIHPHHYARQLVPTFTAAATMTTV